MNLYEYQAKRIFSMHAMNTPKRHVARVESDVADALDILELPLYFKAQILAGGRGKIGGVRRVSTPEEAYQAFLDIRPMVVRNAQTGPAGLPVNAVLIETAQVLSAELYFALVVDRTESCPLLIVSASGGTDIEATAVENPDAILRIPLDPVSGPTTLQCGKIHEFLTLPTLSLKELGSFVQSLFRVFTINDAVLVEINPVGLTPDGLLIALDGKMSLDDSAAFRHQEWAEFLTQSHGNKLEVQAAESGLNYVSMEGGSIGCMVNGAGLAMATMDAIAIHGGAPANFLDVGGGVTVEAATSALRILTSDPNVRVILVNVFGGIVQCDVIAQGIITACNEADVRVPVVVRLEGTNAASGLSHIKASGRRFVIADGLKNAVTKAVELSKGDHVDSH